MKKKEEGPLVLEKAFTTPGAIGDGVVQCLKNAAGRQEVRLSDLLEQTEVFKIGTTSPVNGLINRAGAKTALITTKGHEDAILIGRVSQKTDGLSEAERADSSLWKKKILIQTEQLQGLGRFVLSTVKEKFFRAEEIICRECGSLLEVNIKKA
jgi:N-methylhydantoinase A